MIQDTIRRLLDPPGLSRTEVRGIFDELSSPTTSDAERAAILVGLASRPETVGDVAAFALEMRRRALPFRLAAGDRPVDLCGSGGAPRPSFNVSTVSAFVVAATGTSVVKHGNRSARGLCGSSDLLEALGLPVTTSVPFARAGYRRFRLAFLHAPLFHPATRAVVPIRKLLGIPTVFNRLGPMTNPAHVPFQVVGMPDLAAAQLTASVLPRLGVERGLAMTSADGCDEFSPRASTTAIVWSRRQRRRIELDPATYLPSVDRRGDWSSLPPSRAAAECERILAGGGGARRGSVLLTSGAALWVTGRSRTFAHGVDRARAALDDGSAERLLHRMQRLAAHYQVRLGG